MKEDRFPIWELSVKIQVSGTKELQDEGVMPLLQSQDWPALLTVYSLGFAPQPCPLAASSNFQPLGPHKICAQPQPFLLLSTVRW